LPIHYFNTLEHNIKINIIMNFSYVNFPKLPDEFIQPCLDMLPMIETSPFLRKLNELEGPAVRITIIPALAQKWIYENIVFKYFKHISNNLMMPFTHVSQHMPNLKQGPESHPIHIDYGRKYAFNYFIDTGGDNIWTHWYDSDRNKIESHRIEPFRWHIIATNPELHSADGIEIGRKRISVSLSWDPPIPKPEFNAREYWKDFLE
jgi:hypothetical protein